MAVFPEQMDKLDVNDTAGSLRRVESYIRYMTERVEFSNKNTTREVTEAGVSNVAVYQTLLEMANAMSVLQSTMNGMAGDITSLNGRVNAVQGDISAMQTNISTIQSDISTMKSDISDLKDRVTALEGGGTEGT